MRRLSIAFLPFVVLSVVASAASATFPGRNGPLVFHEVGGKESVLSSHWTFDPRTRRSRDLVRCDVDVSYWRGCYATGGSLSRDGRRLAIYYERRHGRDAPTTGTLVIVPITGGPWRPIAVHGVADPVWSPSGSYLLVTRKDVAGVPDLYLVATDGRELGRVTYGGASQADWAKNGTIAFVRGGDVWTTRLGRPERRVTAVGDAAAPSFAPDGRRLVFASQHGVWKVPTSGSTPVRLTPEGMKAVDPVWSPDGTKIAFAEVDGFTGQSMDVWIMRSNRRGMRRHRFPVGWTSISDILWRSLPRVSGRRR